jgi:hypothetical protein
LKVNVKVEVPEFLVPMIKELRRRTGLQKDAIAQRVYDKFLPMALAGDVEIEKLATIDTLMDVFPEFKEACDRAFESVGLELEYKGKTTDEFMQGISGSMMVGMVLDAAAADAEAA